MSRRLVRWALPVARAVALLALAAVAASSGAVEATASTVPSRDLVHAASSTAARTVFGSFSAHTAAQLPGGGRRIFHNRFLVAYYGTANTGALGVLGEASPHVMTQRLIAAARPFRHSGMRIQIVYELVASIADAGPGSDGDYSHYLARSDVRRYVRAARLHDALLVLDLQPGRSDFLTQAHHFGWALRRPWVGLALDPEWRMGPHQVPAQTVGSVTAAEVNGVSRYVSRIVEANDLPQKVFMLHQFRPQMIRHIGRIVHRPGLAMVQHVDGFGTRRQKLATFHRVVRPRRFTLGFKLFYDEDIHLFTPKQVLRIRPRISYVSYQ